MLHGGEVVGAMSLHQKEFESGRCLPKFAGREDEDADLWLTSWVQVAKIIDVEEKDFLKTLPGSLVDTAQRWYLRQLKTMGSNFQSFELFKKSFLREFAVHGKKDISEAYFNCKQGSKSMRDYFLDFSDAAERNGSKPDPSLFVRNANPAIQSKMWEQLSRNPDWEINELYEYARLITVTKPEIQSLSPQPRSMQRSKPLVCYRCGKMNHIATKCQVPASIQCRRCKKTGHIERACLSKHDNELPQRKKNSSSYKQHRITFSERW